MATRQEFIRVRKATDLEGPLQSMSIADIPYKPLTSPHIHVPGQSAQSDVNIIDTPVVHTVYPDLNSITDTDPIPDTGVAVADQSFVDAHTGLSPYTSAINELQTVESQFSITYKTPAQLFHDFTECVPTEDKVTDAQLITPLTLLARYIEHETDSHAVDACKKHVKTKQFISHVVANEFSLSGYDNLLFFLSTLDASQHPRLTTYLNKYYPPSVDNSLVQEPESPCIDRDLNSVSDAPKITAATSASVIVSSQPSALLLSNNTSLPSTLAAISPDARKAIYTTPRTTCQVTSTQFWQNAEANSSTHSPLALTGSLLSPESVRRRLDYSEQRSPDSNTYNIAQTDGISDDTPSRKNKASPKKSKVKKSVSKTRRYSLRHTTTQSTDSDVTGLSPIPSADDEDSSLDDNPLDDTAIDSVVTTTDIIITSVTPVSTTVGGTPVTAGGSTSTTSATTVTAVTAAPIPSASTSTGTMAAGHSVPTDPAEFKKYVEDERNKVFDSFRPIFDLFASSLDPTKEKDRKKMTETMYMLPKPFDGLKPAKARDHWNQFDKYILFQNTQRNLAEIGEIIQMFGLTLTDLAYDWFARTKAKFTSKEVMRDLFLQRFNSWGRSHQEQLAAWNKLTFDPQNQDIDAFLVDLNTLGSMIASTDEQTLRRFKEAMPKEVQPHLLGIDTLERAVNIAREILQIYQANKTSLAPPLPMMAHLTTVTPEQAKAAASAVDNTPVNTPGAESNYAQGPNTKG